MSRLFDDAQEERWLAERDRHVADELDIDIDTLREHPYDLREHMAQGVVVSWHICWDEGAPDGVRVEGSPGAYWSVVAVGHSDDDMPLQDPSDQDEE